MSKVEERIRLKGSVGRPETCLDADCYMLVFSTDEIGESAKSFNALVHSLAKSFEIERTVKSFTK